MLIPPKRYPTFLCLLFILHTSFVRYQAFHEAILNVLIHISLSQNDSLAIQYLMPCACLVLLSNCLHIWISFSPCEVVSQILPQQSTGEASSITQLYMFNCTYVKHLFSTKFKMYINLPIPTSIFLIRQRASNDDSITICFLG